MMEGTVATAELLLERLTTTPPEGAALLNFTVPCEALPPVTFEGLRVREDTEGGNKVNVAVSVVPFRDAEMVMLVEFAEEEVLTLKVALLDPEPTVTVAGAVPTAVLLLRSVTTIPPDGATPLSLTVPCELLPPATLAGLSVSEESEGGVKLRVAICMTPP